MVNTLSICVLHGQPRISCRVSTYVAKVIHFLLLTQHFVQHFFHKWEPPHFHKCKLSTVRDSTRFFPSLLRAAERRRQSFGCARVRPYSRLSILPSVKVLLALVIEIRNFLSAIGDQDKISRQFRTIIFYWGSFSPPTTIVYFFYTLASLLDSM